MKWEQTNWREHQDASGTYLSLLYKAEHSRNKSIWCTFTSSLINQQGQLRTDFVQRAEFMLRNDRVIFSSSSS